MGKTSNPYVTFTYTKSPEDVTYRTGIKLRGPSHLYTILEIPDEDDDPHEAVLAVQEMENRHKQELYDLCSKYGLFLKTFKKEKMSNYEEHELEL